MISSVRADTDLLAVDEEEALRLSFGRRDLRGLHDEADHDTTVAGPFTVTGMSTEDLEQYEADLELQLYKEYKDVSPMFSFVVETDSRTYVELELRDAWVWDMYRSSRFVPSVRVVTFKDVNVEELPKKDIL
jgi:hypothetical protein